MKISNKFILKEVGDTYIVVPTEDKTVSFNAMITLNGSGAFLWQCLQKDTTEDEVIEELVKKYGIDRCVAKTDVAEFVKKLTELKILE